MPRYSNTHPLHVSPLEEKFLRIVRRREVFTSDIESKLKAVLGRGAGGALYTTLSRLEERKLITKRWGDESDCDNVEARRRYWSILPKGEEALSRIERINRELED